MHKTPSSSDSEDIPWGILQDLDWEEVKQKEKEEESHNVGGEQEYELLEYDVRGLHLRVKQQKRLGIGFQMWPAGLVLGEYFMLGTHLHDKESAQPPQQVSNVDEIQPGWWQGKRVLEVGAGLGLPGMCAASLGAKVTLTDLPDILPLLRWNVEANPQVSSNCTVEPLSWGSEDGELLGKFDVIIGADVVYWEHLFPLLLKTLEDTSDDNTVIFIAWAKRRAGDKGFFRQARKKFVCEPIQITWTSTVCTSNKAMKKMNLLRLQRRKK